MNYFLVRDDRGTPLHLAAVMTDISDRKQIEQALRQSEEQYRHIFESATDCLVVVDTGGTIVAAKFIVTFAFVVVMMTVSFVYPVTAITQGGLGPQGPNDFTPHTDENVAL